MPLYTVMTQSGVLTAETKARLAEDLTSFRRLFRCAEDLGAHHLSGASARQRLHAALTLLIQTGRSLEYKRGLIKRLWELFQGAARSCRRSADRLFESNTQLSIKRFGKRVVAKERRRSVHPRERLRARNLACAPEQL
jgi:hypothetical protein